jgi:pimeloyl-ACP methyl ester carboxylesterase
MRRLAVMAAAIWLSMISLAAPAGAAEKWEQLPAPAAMPTPAESGTVKVNGADIYYAVYGQGEPVLLLHGGLGNADYWGNQIPALAEKYKVIVMDSRGHGRSTRDAQPYSYGLMAEDVIGVLDHLGVGKAAIVGWSDGGIIGLDLAINHPDRVAKLFAFGANTQVSGLREDLPQSTVFNRYIENAGKDYERLSTTPEDYEGFVNADVELAAGLQAGAARQDHSPGDDRRRRL